MIWTVVIHPRSHKFIELNIDEHVYDDVVAEANVRISAYAVCAYLALLDDSPLGSHTKPLRLYTQLLHESEESFVFMIQRFSRLADRLLHEGTDNPVFIEEMLTTPIFYEYMMWLSTLNLESSWAQDLNGRLLTYILSFLRFLKRLELQMPHLEVVALRDWLECEERIGSFDETSANDVKEFIAATLPAPDFSLFKPKFGPGVTADVKSRIGRNKAYGLTLPRKIRRLFDFGIVPSPDPSRSFLETLPFPLEEGLDCPNEQAFVPKDPSKVRSICFCTNAEMFFQQGVLNMFMNAFKTSPLLRASIKLQDQTFNQMGARSGSIQRTLDTIDLSSASDSVSWALIKKIFPREWRILLRQTRSDKVLLPDGRVVKVKKFAPMGSAVCFPVQCLVFLGSVYSASVQWALRGGLISRRPCGKDEVRNFCHQFMLMIDDAPYLRDQLLSPAVYGDDIICDSKITSDVIDTLQKLAFSVNEAKSFMGNHGIRESCGKYYADGVDITPFNLRTPYFDSTFHANAFASIMEQSMLCKERSWFSLRSYLLHAWEQNSPYWIRNKARRNSTTPLGLTSIGRRRRCYNLDWQREEAEVLCVVAKRNKIRDPLNKWDAYSLYVWEHQDHRDEPSPGHPRRVPYSARYGVEYLPV